MCQVVEVVVEVVEVVVVARRQCVHPMPWPAPRRHGYLLSCDGSPPIGSSRAVTSSRASLVRRARDVASAVWPAVHELAGMAVTPVHP